MGRFNNDRFTGRNSGRSESRRPLTMFPAVCDSCGKDCQVPFRPSGDKPIYCSDCFERQGNGNSDRRERRSFGDSSNREMFHAVCDNCGKDCEVPFKPSTDKPIYCSRCFEEKAPKREDRGSRAPRRDSFSGGSNSNAEISQLKDQLSSMSSKLDKILKILSPVITEEVADDTPKEKKVVKKVVKKAATKKKVE